MKKPFFACFWSMLSTLLLSLLSPAFADVTLPNLLSDGCVLQQKTKTRIYGTASPQETVTVMLQGQKITTTTDDLGHWFVWLNNLKPGGPFPLKIQGKNTVTRSVYVGEVWVCSGQSNMELGLITSFEGEKAVVAATDPQIHLFRVPYVRQPVSQTEVKSSWTPCTPETARTFSAVAYYFAKEISKKQHVPVGLIASYWGGTPAEAWTPISAMLSDGWLGQSLVRNYTRSCDNYLQNVFDFPTLVEAKKALGQPAPQAPRTPWGPGELYNAMIAPLTPYTIQGALWYQGEANVGRQEQYKVLLPAMISAWRDAWEQPNFPFYIVQLAPFSAGNSNAIGYAEMREAQVVLTKATPHTGIISILDVGEENDIHPKKKKPVGERLAYLAERDTYGIANAPLSPEIKTARVVSASVVLTFSNVGSGLKSTDGALAGFTLAGDDDKFYDAVARVTGKDTVTVTAKEVTSPKSVRYAFRNYIPANLASSQGLPAFPFRMRL
jgi:sialate O-acetylesterase